MEHGLFGWLVIIIGLVFIFGGSKKLEDLGKGFGSFMREFNKAKNAGDKEIEEAAKAKELKEEPKKLEAGKQDEPKP